jgi:nitrate reductase gamma subunit
VVETQAEQLSEYLEESDRTWEAEEASPELRRVRLAREAFGSQLRWLLCAVLVFVAFVAVLFVPLRVTSAVDGLGDLRVYLLVFPGAGVAGGLWLVGRGYLRLRRVTRQTETAGSVGPS